ncbi:MAG: NAD(P)/FAD-dependent oxidoreductase [Actinomycetota bacterium]
MRDSPVMTRILIVGGGYTGLYTALRLEKKLRKAEADITLVSAESFMTYQPFLPEAASGSIEPRHVVVPLRSVLRRTRVVAGRLTALDHDSRIATVRPRDGDAYELSYNLVVIGLGSVSRVLPVPGLAETAIGFKTVAEAIHLRNRVLERMDAAESLQDPDLRRRALTFTFVGGGYAGVEALAELEDLARDASRHYARIDRDDMRWILIEATDRILPEIGGGLDVYALEVLARRGIEIHLGTRLDSAEHGRMRLSDGTEFESDTLVWTTGVRPHPLVEQLGFPIDDKGRVITDRFLRVEGIPEAWAAGDCAAVPDVTTGGMSPSTAQHALRQARVLADNVTASLRGAPLSQFAYRNLGGIVSLGRHRGVARVLRFRLRGFPAWWLHRTYHLSRIPTLNRKIRIAMDWTVALFFRRDVVQLGSLQRPRDPFAEAVEDAADRDR